jgi:uncharacterized protein
MWTLYTLEQLMAKSGDSFVWYELMTSDQAAATRFYTDVVGWSAKDSGMPGVKYTLLETVGKQIGGLMNIPAHCEDLRPCWVGYVAVADVDASAHRVGSLGGAIHRKPDDIPGVGRFAVVADPKGAVFHLFKANQPGTSTHSMQRGHIGWHELHTTDWSGSWEFYQGLFGWQKDRDLDMGPMGTYRIFAIDGPAVGAMFNSTAATEHPFWLYYFAVEDIQAAKMRVERGGGSIMMGPMEVPGGAMILQGRDPQGAMFALVAPPPGGAG